MRASLAILVLGSVLASGCVSSSDDGTDRMDDADGAGHCAALRDHLIGLRLPGGFDSAAQRDAYLRALGDELVASCLQSATDAAASTATADPLAPPVRPP